MALANQCIDRLRHQNRADPGATFGLQTPGIALYFLHMMCAYKLVLFLLTWCATHVEMRRRLSNPNANRQIHRHFNVDYMFDSEGCGTPPLLFPRARSGVGCPLALSTIGIS